MRISRGVEFKDEMLEHIFFFFITLNYQDIIVAQL